MGGISRTLLRKVPIYVNSLLVGRFLVIHYLLNKSKISEYRLLFHTGMTCLQHLSSHCMKLFIYGTDNQHERY